MGSRWLGIERDKLGRIARMEMPGRVRPGNPVPETEVVSYEYDTRGDLVCAKNGSAVVAFVRDALGRVIEERQGDVRIERGYDAAGAFVLRRTSLGHEARFAWDREGELEGGSSSRSPAASCRGGSGINSIDRSCTWSGCPAGTRGAGIGGRAMRSSGPWSHSRAPIC
jgi:YD repeat-containing protein